MIIEAEKNPNGYNIIQVLDVLRMLSHSNGFYSRLYYNIIEMKETDEEEFEKFKNEMESQNFKDEIDVIMYFEEVPTFKVTSL